jgi:GT2 family glycosyltransferase
MPHPLASLKEYLVPRSYEPPPAEARITFAIPFWGNLDYLRRTVASVFRQSVRDWRAVVVDDCNPMAGAREITNDFEDARLTYVRNDHNLGQARTMNRCLELSRTPFNFAACRRRAVAELRTSDARCIL